MNLTIADILTRKVCTIVPDDTLAHAASLMAKKRISCTVALSGGKPVGILTEADLVRIGHLHIDMQATTVQGYLSQPVISIATDQSVYEAFDFLLEHHVRHLVVVDVDGHLQGILTFSDILKAAEFDDFLFTKPIRNDMSRNVVTLKPSESVDEALGIMDNRHISCVVMVDEEGKAIGMFSERDATRLLAASDDLSALSMNDVMSQPLVSMHEQDSLLDALQSMHKHRFRHIVIVDDMGVPTGTLTQFNVIRGLEGKRIQELKRSYLKIQGLQAAKVELEQRYHRLFEESRDMMHIVDAGGHIIDVNRAALKALGYSREEMIGKPVKELTAPECLKESADCTKILFQGESISLRETLLLSKAGNRIPMELSATPQLENGKVVAYHTILRDITERKQRERLLARRERQIAVLAEAGRVINEQFNERDIGRNLVNLARRLVDCDSGTVGFYHDNKICFREYIKGSERTAIELDFPSDYGVPGVVLKTKRAYISADAPNDEHVIPEIQQRFGFIKLIDVPMLDANDNLLGCFEMHDRLDGKDFDDQDLEMLQSLASIVAASLINIQQHSQIKASAVHMRQVLDAEFDAVIVHQHFRVIFANKAAQKLFGFVTLKEAVGRSVLDYMPASYRKLAERAVRSALHRGHAFDRVEVKALHPHTGEVFPIEITNTMVQWDNQPAVVSIVRDISERHQAERDLREVHERHREAQRIAHLGHWSLDLANNKLQWSEEVFRIFEIEPEHFGASYETFLDAVHPDDRKAVDSAYSKSLVTQQPYDIEHRLLLPDGRIKWVREQCESEFDQDGKPLRSLGTVLDTTQRRQQAEQMQLLESAVGSINESIIITDTDGTVVYVNPAFTTSTGFEPEDAIGKTPAILNSKQQSKHFYDTFWRKILDGEPWSGRIMDRKKDGTIFPVYLSVAPIFNDHGEISHFVAIHEDLTRAEEIQKGLMQTQRMEAVGTMVGGLAHDFNNMLASMVGNLFLMRKQHSDDAKTVARIEGMERSVHHGANMIKQMLTFARKDRPKMHTMDLKAFIKEAHKMAEATLPENIKFKLEYSTQDDFQITGDVTQLQQVLLNLVTNARHAVALTEAPEIALTLDRSEPPRQLLEKHPEMSSDNGWCRISCADNGSGIAPELLERIFEPFFTTREAGEGTGLGLAMVYGALQNHSGIIDVQSEAGQGTRFSIWLPLQEETHIAVEKRDEIEVNGSGITVLIVDDEEALRKVLVEVLRQSSFTVLHASDGEQAVEIFTRHKDTIDLILMDVVMPNKGGVMAAREIRKISADVPIIFQTGYGEQTELDAVGAIPYSESLRKPVQVPTLLRMIMQHGQPTK